MQYEQIIDGYYEGGEVKGIDMLNFKPLTKDYFKSRPDMKQRVEKAINTQTYLAAYQRGTRLGWKFITKEEADQHLELKVEVMNSIYKDIFYFSINIFYFGLGNINFDQSNNFFYVKIL